MPVGGGGEKVFAMPRGAGSWAAGGALGGSAAAGTATCSFRAAAEAILELVLVFLAAARADDHELSSAQFLKKNINSHSLRRRAAFLLRDLHPQELLAEEHVVAMF